MTVNNDTLVEKFDRLSPAAKNKALVFLNTLLEEEKNEGSHRFEKNGGRANGVCSRSEGDMAFVKGSRKYWDFPMAGW